MDGQTPVSPKIIFEPAAYARYQVTGLSPTEVDEMLANGYFRSDINVIAAVLQNIDGGWRPTVLLRIPLQGFVWKKKLRKLMRRNAGLFEVAIRPFQPRPEVDLLWQAFKKTVHRWNNISEFSLHLFRGRQPVDFNTWEVGVYHAGDLVAISVFDRGGHSIASLEAAYHPDFKQYSLGIYTMLMELEFCEAQKLRWYYPGMFPKDSPMFEYKLRPGGIEFFSLRKKAWLPWGDFSQQDWLYAELLEKLGVLKNLLHSHGIESNFCQVMRLTPTSGARGLGGHNFSLQFLLRDGTDRLFEYHFVWDLLRQVYGLFRRGLVANSAAPILGNMTYKAENEFVEMGVSPDEDALFRLVFGK